VAYNPKSKTPDLDTDCFTTPRWFCSAAGRFDLDTCSNPYSAVDAERHYMLEEGDNGLTDPWFGRAWSNPPYSRPHPWCRKMIRHGRGMMLLKADPTTKWFSTLFKGGARIWFLKERIRFGYDGLEDMTAPWPCIVVCVGEPLPEALAPFCWPDYLGKRLPTTSEK